MTSYTFDGSVSRTVGSHSTITSRYDVKVTLKDDDGSLDVGDAVEIEALYDSTYDFDPDGLSGTGWADGDTVYYLGTFSLPDSGQVGYIFGNSADPDSATEFAMLLDEVPLIGPGNYGLSDNETEAFRHFLNSNDRSTELGDEPACFAEGTLIATPDGERSVEDLNIGDMIKTADGRIVPVKWVGRQTLIKMFMGERAQLVRIKAGVLDTHSDLYLTGDHGILLGGYIINASALVNGSTIDWVPMSQTPDRHVVYHVETDEHDIILANGAASETFLDSPARESFDNSEEFKVLYINASIVREIGLPRISSVRLLPEHLSQVVS